VVIFLSNSSFVLSYLCPGIEKRLFRVRVGAGERERASHGWRFFSTSRELHGQLLQSQVMAKPSCQRWWGGGERGTGSPRLIVGCCPVAQATAVRDEDD
jgi:hypothetical protein